MIRKSSISTGFSIVTFSILGYSQSAFFERAAMPRSRSPCSPSWELRIYGYLLGPHGLRNFPRSQILMVLDVPFKPIQDRKVEIAKALLTLFRKDSEGCLRLIENSNEHFAFYGRWYSMCLWSLWKKQQAEPSSQQHHHRHHHQVNPALVRFAFGWSLGIIWKMHPVFLMGSPEFAWRVPCKCVHPSPVKSPKKAGSRKSRGGRRRFPLSDHCGRVESLSPETRRNSRNAGSEDPRSVAVS